MLVTAFHQRFGLPAPDYPPLIPDPREVRLRARLIREEYEEVMVELAVLAAAADPHGAVLTYRRLLKELADLRYVTEGTAVSFGLPLDEAYACVHSSNMSKTGSKDAGGKVMKGPGYVPPNMSYFVRDIIEHA